MRAQRSTRSAPLPRPAMSSEPLAPADTTAAFPAPRATKRTATRGTLPSVSLCSRLRLRRGCSLLLWVGAVLLPSSVLVIVAVRRVLSAALNPFLFQSGILPVDRLCNSGTLGGTAQVCGRELIHSHARPRILALHAVSSGLTLLRGPVRAAKNCTWAAGSFRVAGTCGSGSQCFSQCVLGSTLTGTAP